MYNPIIFIVTDPCLFQSGQGRVLPFCTSERPVHLLYTLFYHPFLIGLKWETVNPVPPQIVLFFDLFTSMYRNNGLPITAVITPTGTPVDPTTLPMQSHTMRNELQM